MKRQKAIVNIITLIVILTISIQTYWNYNQYIINRNQINREVQNALDLALNQYFQTRTKKVNFADSLNPENQISALSQSQIIDFQITNSLINDSSLQKLTETIENLKQENASQTTKMIDPQIYSMNYNLIDLKEINSKLETELTRKNHHLDHYLMLYENGEIVETFGETFDKDQCLIASSQIIPVLSNMRIELYYANPFWTALIRGLTGIILSFVLCLVVIFSLYFLISIIKRQKQMSIVKNDFISNITHEFKTPISVISSVIESLKNFNNEQVSDKTKRYLDISAEQIERLNLLVEKVMETSLLESSQLSISLETHDLILLVKKCTEKYRLITTKTINHFCNIESYLLELDQFHFENTLSNLIDNAIKYGGDLITVEVNNYADRITIAVSDNGFGVSKQDEPYIFDKFYRSPNQNIHEVRGFGIGLYYAKNIVEKHNGTIELTGKNIFLITLWKK